MAPSVAVAASVVAHFCCRQNGLRVERSERGRFRRRCGAGATFKTLGRKSTPQGRAVISRYLDELDEAETRVNEIYFAWRSGAATELDELLDATLDRWRSLPDGGDLVVEWPATRPARRRSGSQ